MTKPEVLNYDSPWEAIVEAAQTQLSDKSPPTCLLTDNEISDLTGLPVCVVETDGAPAPEDRPARGAFLRQQAEQKGWKYTEYMDWGFVSDAAHHGSGVSWRGLPLNTSGIPALRQGAGFGSEFDLGAPLAHRLTGDRMPVLGVIILDAAYSHGFGCGAFAPLPTARSLSQLHEMFHLLQLYNDCPKDRVLDRVQRERDADYAAVTAFQTCCNGSPVDAARYIMARTLSMVCGRSTSKYFFWPGLGADELLRGPLWVNSIFLLGLYEQAGEARPAPALMDQWSLQEFMSRDMYEQHRIQLDKVNAFVSETVHQHPLGPAAALRGIAMALDRNDPYLTGPRNDLARKVVQSALILRPDFIF